MFFSCLSLFSPTHTHRAPRIPIVWQSQPSSHPTYTHDTYCHGDCGVYMDTMWGDCSECVWYVHEGWHDSSCLCMLFLLFSCLSWFWCTYTPRKSFIIPFICPSYTHHTPDTRMSYTTSCMLSTYAGPLVPVMDAWYMYMKACTLCIVVHDLSCFFTSFSSFDLHISLAHSAWPSHASLLTHTILHTCATYHTLYMLGMWKASTAC